METAGNRIARWVIITLGGLVTLVAVFSILRLGFIFWIYSYISNWATVQLGLDYYGAEFFAVTVTVALALLFPGVGSFILTKKRRIWIASLTVAGYLGLCTVMYGRAQHVYFNRVTGEPLRYYIDTPDGREFSFTPGYHPVIGLPYTPYTREVIIEDERKRLERLRQLEKQRQQLERSQQQLEQQRLQLEQRRQELERVRLEVQLRQQELERMRLESELRQKEIEQQMLQAEEQRRQELEQQRILAQQREQELERQRLLAQQRERELEEQRLREERRQRELEERRMEAQRRQQEIAQQRRDEEERRRREQRERTIIGLADRLTERIFRRR